MSNNGNIYLIDIKYDGATEQVHCEKVEKCIYRCLESCIFIDFIKYGCEIEVEETGDELNFLGLYKESPFQEFFYVWSKEIVESAGCDKLKNEIINRGGYWESAMGGVFIIHLPPEKKDQIEDLLKVLNDNS